MTRPESGSTNHTTQQPQASRLVSVAPPAHIAPTATPISTVSPQGQDIGQDTGMRLLVPVGRSGFAVAAGYLALPGIVPMFGLPFAVAAIVFAIIAHGRIRRDPKLHGMGRVVFAYIFAGLSLAINAALFLALLFAD